MHWIDTRSVVLPSYSDLHESGEALRVARIRARAPQNAGARRTIRETFSEALAHGLTQKYLHGPLAALNRSEGEDRKQLLAWMPRLFPGRDSRR